MNFLTNREAISRHRPRLGERTNTTKRTRTTLSVMKNTKVNTQNQTPILDETSEDTIPVGGFRGEESLPAGGFRGEESLPAGGFRYAEELPLGGFRG